MNRMFTCTYYTPQGRKEVRVTPFLPNISAAFLWLARIKPHIWDQALTIEIKAHQRGDPR